MEMEVMKPSALVDFNFDSACTSPYISAPSSPPPFGTPFFSAPTSPTRASALYNDFNNFPNGGSTTGVSLSAVAFNWEEKPGIAKTTQINYAHQSHHHQTNDDNKDFAFDFSGQLEKSSLPADELFHGGKIKPLKPPPRLQYESKPADSPKSPRSPKKMFKEAFSPRHKSKDFDPFAAALENTRMEDTTIKESANDHQRGREKRSHNDFTASSSRQKGTRSLSPFRVSDLLFDPENDQEKPKKVSSMSSSSTSTSSSSSFSSSWYRKWKLKDLLLFRSASEGRATSKAQLNKYAMLKKTTQEDDVKNASFRSTDSVGSVSSSRRRSGPISAHELHYTMNRAVAEEMKRKTFLPYKQGWLGCLGFNPAVNEISRGLGSMNRG